MDPAWIALIGTLFGGVALKIVEQLLGRNKIKDDTASVMRTEMRGDQQALRALVDKKDDELDEQRDEIDSWRSKYYELVAAVASGDIARAVEVITSHRK